MAIDKQFWNDKYVNNQTGWDVGTISNPLKIYFNQLIDKNIAILIPGCGNAHEAEYLLENGFTDISLIDISELVVDELKYKLKKHIDDGNLKIICGNFFDLIDKFGLIIEQTFFCAIDPSLRSNYASKMHSLLTPNGKVIGLLFSFPLTSEGPPFGGSFDEYQNYFNELFQIQKMEPCYNSIEPRKGRELFFILLKRESVL